LTLHPAKAAVTVNEPTPALIKSWLWDGSPHRSPFGCKSNLGLATQASLVTVSIRARGESNECVHWKHEITQIFKFKKPS
jgi:hypothetical protein